MEEKQESVDRELARLKDKAKALAEFNYGPRKSREDRFLALAIEAWVQTISQRALSIALLLENSDLESVLVLMRTLREKCIDLALICSWDRPEDAALRAHIYQRLQHKRLAVKNPDVATNPTLKNMDSDLKQFEETYPRLYEELAQLAKSPPVRSHWSGLEPEERLAKASIVDPLARKVQDLLSIEVHGSLDLAAKRECTPEMIIVTANYVCRWIGEVENKLLDIRAKQIRGV